MRDRPSRPASAAKAAPASPTSAAAAAASSIVVGVRVRPLTVAERYGSQRPLVRVVDDQVLCFDPACDDHMHIAAKVKGARVIGHRAAKDQKYAFDCVFDTDATQEQVYQGTARPQIDSVLGGYNATVFAYGATGAGKTHTMIGDKVAGPGVMVLAMEDLFAAIESTALDSKYELSLSYLEVYNEQIRDLLSPDAARAVPVDGISGAHAAGSSAAVGGSGVCSSSAATGADAAPTAAPPQASRRRGGAAPSSSGVGGLGLSLREDARNGIHVAGLSHHRPRSSDEVLEMLQRGNASRAMSATEANAVSSRSHAVLQICIRETAKTAGLRADIKTGKLSLIDLAGSERASVTSNRGLQLCEGANINKSLLALSNCINALGRGDVRHIPYRDSKLTRLLKDSLGGNCKTTMIAAVSPARAAYEDTLNTLKYANRAKEIKLKATRNTVKVDYHIAKYVDIISQLRDEVALWKRKYAEAAEAVRPPRASPSPDAGGAEARESAAGGGAPGGAGSRTTGADGDTDVARGQAAYVRIEKTYGVAANALTQLGDLRVHEREAAEALARDREADAAAVEALEAARARAASAPANGADPARSAGAVAHAESEAAAAAERRSASEAAVQKYALLRKGLHATLSASYAEFDKIDRALTDREATVEGPGGTTTPRGGGEGQAAPTEPLYIRAEERRALLQQEIRCRVLQLRNLDLSAKLRAQPPHASARAPAQAAGAAVGLGSGAGSGVGAASATTGPEAHGAAGTKHQAQSAILDSHGISTTHLAAQYSQAAQVVASSNANARAANPSVGGSRATAAGDADGPARSMAAAGNSGAAGPVARTGATARQTAGHRAPALTVGVGAAGGSDSPLAEGPLARGNVIPSPAVRRSIGKLFSPAAAGKAHGARAAAVQAQAPSQPVTARAAAAVSESSAPVASAAAARQGRPPACAEATGPGHRAHTQTATTQGAGAGSRGPGAAWRDGASGVGSSYAALTAAGDCGRRAGQPGHAASVPGVHLRKHAPAAASRVSARGADTCAAAGSVGREIRDRDGDGGGPEGREGGEVRGKDNDADGDADMLPEDAVPDKERGASASGGGGGESVFSRLFAASSASARAKQHPAAALEGGIRSVLHESNRAAHKQVAFGGVFVRPTTAAEASRTRASRVTMPAGARRPQTAALGAKEDHLGAGETRAGRHREGRPNWM